MRPLAFEFLLFLFVKIRNLSVGAFRELAVSCALKYSGRKFSQLTVVYQSLLCEKGHFKNFHPLTNAVK